MRNNNNITRFFFLFIFAFPISLFSQCVLPSGTYQWGSTQLDGHVKNNCDGIPNHLVIPTDATISIRNNDPWDLTIYGPIVLTIEGNGSLKFNGKDELTFASGSTIIIEDSSNSDALSKSGNGKNVAINIGGTSYTGQEFDQIIDAGGATENGPLPVELVFFEGNISDENQINLNWITASETNNSHFEIEYSKNSRDFYHIASINGYGNTTQKQQYHFVHNEPNFGMNYYRLKQVDYDGNFEYSDVINVELKNESKFELMTNSLNLLKFSILDHSILNVFNMAGQLVLSEKIQAGEHEYTFDDFTRGTYAVNILTISNHTHETFLISK